MTTNISRITFSFLFLIVTLENTSNAQMVPPGSDPPPSLPGSGMPSGYVAEDDSLLKAYFGNGAQSDVSAGWIEVPDSEEWEPSSGPANDYAYGAIVVANKNDTDSDGFIDSTEGGNLPVTVPTNQRIISGTSGVRFEEVDLIKIVVTLPPSTNGKLGSNDGNIQFWADTQKTSVFEMNGLPNSFCTSASFENLSSAAKSWTVYAEVPHESSVLNDKAIWFENRTSETFDRIRITAIWSSQPLYLTKRNYYSQIVRVGEFGSNVVDVEEPFSIGDQLSVYDDNGIFDSGKRAFVANVLNVETPPTTISGARLTLSSVVPDWVTSNDFYSKGISKLNDGFAIRGNSQMAGYDGRIGHARDMPTASWVIEVGFKMKPTGITRATLSTGKKIRFDMTRQAYANRGFFGKYSSQVWVVRQGINPENNLPFLYSPIDEWANDDAYTIASPDEDCDTSIPNWLSASHTSSTFTYAIHDMLFQIDAPGRSRTDFFTEETRYVYRGNFFDFPRVSFDGHPPVGNRISGTRCGFKVGWNTRIDLVANLSSPNGKNVVGDDIYFAMKNTAAESIVELYSNQTGEPNVNAGAASENNMIIGGKHLRFSEILNLPDNN